MSLKQALENFSYYFRHQPFRTATKSSLAEIGVSVGKQLDSLFSERGTPIYDREWDLLIVLDTCRVDALAAVADEYEFLPELIPQDRSVGSKTREWMTNNFTEEFSEKIQDTAYITFNGHSEYLLNTDDFAYLGEVWRDYWDVQLGGVPPRPITEYTIKAGRCYDPNYLIAHYKQPHQPYTRLKGFNPTNRNDNKANDRSGVFGALIEGRFTRREIWKAYLDELRWALDEVNVLLDNVDADRVAITADHGECFGEWGIYGHDGCKFVPQLVQVPFVPIGSASDTGQYTPTVSLNASDESKDVSEQLAALGYR